MPELSEIQLPSISRTPADETTNAAARLKKACQDFESLFIGHLLRTMRSSANEGGLFGNGLGGDYYQSILESEVAHKVSGSGGMGLADILYRSFLKNGVISAATEGGATEALSPLTNEIIFNRVHNFECIISSAADSYDLEKELLYAMIGQESTGNRYAISPKGAKGLMQLMDGTAAELGVSDVFDPQQNIFGGAHYMRRMLDAHGGDLRTALAAYNAGPRTIAKYKGIPPFAETKQYITRVLSLSQLFKTKLETLTAQLTE